MNPNLDLFRTLLEAIDTPARRHAIRLQHPGMLLARLTTIYREDLMWAARERDPHWFDTFILPEPLPYLLPTMADAIPEFRHGH